MEYDVTVVIIIVILMLYAIMCRMEKFLHYACRIGYSSPRILSIIIVMELYTMVCVRRNALGPFILLA